MGAGMSGDGDETGACRESEARFVVDGGAELALETPNGSWYTNAVPPSEAGAWRFFVGFQRGAAAESDWYRFAMFGGHGNMLTQLGGPREVLVENAPIAIGDSVWALQASATTLGELLCTTEGSGSTVLRHDADLSFDLAQVSSLGTCPGADAVEGELTMCLGFDCNRDLVVAGTVDEQTWPAMLGGYTVGSVVSVSFSDGSLLRFANQGTSLSWGLLFTAPSGPFAGAVFCIGSASLAADTVHWTLGGFSKLGTCPGGGTGTITGCARPASFL